jgi:hypothetical protein
LYVSPHFMSRLQQDQEAEASGATLMGDAKADLSRDEVRQAVRQGILLNEYLLRRAWGLLYLALSLSMFLSIFGIPIVGSLEPIGLASSIVVDMTASGCAIIAILWAFKRVRNAAEITHAEGDRTWSTLLGYRYVVPVWIAVNALVALTLVLARPLVPTAVLLIHLGVALYLYYALRLSFPKRIPTEAVVAVGSLSLSSVASIAMLSVVISPEPYALLWVGTIIAWISSGAYARTRPVPELEEELTGLE